MNAREAKRRQKVIEETLAGLEEIFTTNLHQEMTPEQEEWMIRMAGLIERWESQP